MDPTSSLQTLLLAVASGLLPVGGAIYAMFEKVPFLAALALEPKRYAVAVVAGVLGLACAFLARFMGWLDFPLATSQDIVNATWQYGATIGISAFTGSQLWHARLATVKANASP